MTIADDRKRDDSDEDLMDSGNVDEEENNCKDHSYIQDENISALHWTEFIGELKCQYFHANSWTHQQFITWK